VNQFKQANNYISVAVILVALNDKYRVESSRVSNLTTHRK